MEILYVLIPVSIILITLAIAIFAWAVKSGQYDDLEGPAHSILFDDDQNMIPDCDDQAKTPLPKSKERSEAPSSEDQPS